MQPELFEATDKTIAFAGHRPGRMGGYGESKLQAWARNVIRTEIHTHKPTMVLTGMALGVDTWAAEECIKLSVMFTAVVPFEGQDSRWLPASKTHYQELLKHARKVVVVDPRKGLSDMEASKALLKRNEWMVDRCDTLVAIFDGSPGGTAACIRYAKSRGRKVEIHAPPKG